MISSLSASRLNTLLVVALPLLLVGSLFASLPIGGQAAEEAALPPGTWGAPSPPSVMAAVTSLNGGAGPALGGEVRCVSAGDNAASCYDRPSVNPSVPPSALGFQSPEGGENGPPTVVLANLAWDPLDKEAVFFGGWNGSAPLNETWTFTGGVWINDTSSTDAPPARFDAVMQFDEQPQVDSVLLFGGFGVSGLLNDTWLFSGGAWTELNRTAPAPPPLFDATMSLWGTNGTVLFGGCTITNCTAQSNQTWAFQWSPACAEIFGSACWADLSENGQIRGGSPPALAGAALADDPIVGPENGTLLLYGGFNQSSIGGTREDTNATWFFAGSYWVNATASFDGSPYPNEGRSDAALFWDPSSERLYLYGGYNDSTNSSIAGLWWNDVYSWGNASSIRPPSSEYGISVSSGQGSGPGQQYPAILMGGKNSAGTIQNGTWIFEPSLATEVTVSPNPAVVNTTVSFFSNTTGGTRPTANWSFGDGAFLAGGNGSHTYAQPGAFAANLTATDLYGVQGVSTVTVEVPRFSPGLSAPTVADVGSTVYFSSSPADGVAPFNFTWVFSDGSLSYGASVGHDFMETGEASVELTVRDATGTIASARAGLVVNPRLEGQTRASPGSVNVGSYTTLYASASGGTPPYNYNWTLPDGRISAEQNVSYAPSAAGNVTFGLTLGDAAGTKWITSIPFTVNPPLTFTASSTSPTAFSGRSVAFWTTISGGTAPFAFSWLFGDGGTSTASRPSHVYATSGTFGVNVWVNDSGGGSYHQTLEVKIPRTAGGLVWELAGLPSWALGSLIVAAVLVVSLAALLVMRRYRPGVGSPTPPPTTREEK